MTDHEIPPNEAIWAAGCVVVRSNSQGDPEYLVVHRPTYADWSLPKGKLDEGESFRDAALREVAEETGLVVKNPKPVGSVGYTTKAGNPKVVRWWLTSPASGSFAPNEEVDKIKWLTYEKAQTKLSYRNDRSVVDRANDMVAAKSAGTIHLVRHATAHIRDEADPNDSSRGLDSRGKKQRDALLDDLMTHPITRIGSSHFARCVETVAPVAARLGIPIEREPALTEGSHPYRLVALIHELQKEAAVLCTHGDVIGDLIGHLFAEGVPMDGPMKWAKGSTWRLRTVKGRVVSGVYVPAKF
ncbi:MAG: NUDIX hydrolase [Actinomycetota bacterium]|nr:NUDIX hydrolase [Actinomycetota bacterium]